MIFYNNFTSGKTYDNAKFEELKGYLDDKTAKTTLAEFLYNNLGIATFLLTGWRLFPIQEIVLRSWFDHNFNLAVWARGSSKSSLVSIFCALYPIFHPGTRIVLASNAFRATRRLMVTIERIINGKRAALLKQCYPQESGKLLIQRRNDEWILPINEGHIKALPLNEKLRGERAEIIVVDEFRQVPETIFTEVLVPFLTSKSKIEEQLKIKELEDVLIASGNITEEQRTILETDKKIIGLSSASYEFEFLTRLYKLWVGKIVSDTELPQIKKKYFVSRFSYKAMPEELIDKEITELAKDGGEHTTAFQMEFHARFGSSSDSYFNIRKLHFYTAKPGEYPCVQIKGTPDSKYIVACDPNFNSSSTSDLFGISVLLLNNDNRTITQVASYGRPGGNLSDHLDFFYYVMTSFNVVFVIADLAGEGQGNNFISTANESNLFMKNNIRLDFINGDLDTDDNYLEEVKKAKNSYNLTSRKIVYRQTYHSEWIRRANERLQSEIDAGRVHFASPICSHVEMFQKTINEGLPIIYKDADGKPMDTLDYLALQDDLINETKNQLALIEVKSTTLGTLQFDLPQNLRRDKNPKRARKDLYSCLLMGCWGAKCYWDIMFTQEEKRTYDFQPVLIR